MAVKTFFVAITIAFTFKQTSGHGYMEEPTNRGSLWRKDWTQPANYNDNEFFCGGVPVQYEQNGGKCGVCGDNYAAPRPRSNENTGTFGNGIIAQTYKAGSVVETKIVLTANHLGTFVYSLCTLQDATRPEEEDCFENLDLVGGSDVYQVQDNDYYVYNKLQLPPGLTCDRCVLRWTYTSGNSWGHCADGSQKVGCGAQETFRSCADIKIID